MNSICTIILAAGQGTRMASKKPKVLHKILGKSLLQYVVDTSIELKSSKINVIIGHQGNEIENAFNDYDLNFIYQAERLGTGHAIKIAIDHVPDTDVLILSGDVPLIRTSSLKNLIKKHKAEGNALSLISAHMQNPYGLGRIVRDFNGGFEKIVEEKDANEKEKGIKEINGGIYLFNGKVLKESIMMINNDNKQNEYYLTDTIEIIKNMGLKCEAFEIESSDELFGINTLSQLSSVSKKLQKRINFEHMDNGICIVDPDNTYIGADVVLAEDNIIHPNCSILGKTIIGKSNIFNANCEIFDSNIGDNNTFTNTIIKESKIANNNSFGPFAYLRPNTEVCDNCKIGDFVELKNSIVKSGSKIPHITYIGDSEIGENVNIGCGSITANYDGKNKHKTIIGDNVFVGSNTNLVAPVTIENDSYIAAGSTITKTVKSNTLAIARSRQSEIKNWKKD